MGTALTKQEWYQLRVQNIKAIVTMEALLQHAGVDVMYSSRAAQVQCPMTFNHAHGDRSKSARFYPDSQTFKCYVCSDKAVDVIGFAEMFSHTSFAGAVRWLETTFSIEIPKAELIKDLSEVMEELLEIGSTELAKLEAQRGYGLGKLRDDRKAFTCTQATVLYGVIDELWFDIKQGRTELGKASKVAETWLNKIREIVDRHESLDVI